MWQVDSRLSLEAATSITSKTHWLDEKVSQCGRYFSSWIIWWRWHFQKRETSVGRFESCRALQSFQKVGEKSFVTGRFFCWIDFSCGMTTRLQWWQQKQHDALVVNSCHGFYFRCHFMCTDFFVVVLCRPATTASHRSVVDRHVRKQLVGHFPY